MEKQWRLIVAKIFIGERYRRAQMAFLAAFDWHVGTHKHLDLNALEVSKKLYESKVTPSATTYFNLLYGVNRGTYRLAPDLAEKLYQEGMRHGDAAKKALKPLYQKILACEHITPTPPHNAQKLAFTQKRKSGSHAHHSVLMSMPQHYARVALGAAVAHLVAKKYSLEAIARLIGIGVPQIQGIIAGHYIVDGTSRLGILKLCDYYASKPFTSITLSAIEYVRLHTEVYSTPEMRERAATVMPVPGSVRTQKSRSVTHTRSYKHRSVDVSSYDPDTVMGAMCILSIEYVKSVEPAASHSVNGIAKAIDRAMGVVDSARSWFEKPTARCSWNKLEAFMAVIVDGHRSPSWSRAGICALKTLRSAGPGYLAHSDNVGGLPLAILPSESSRSPVGDGFYAKLSRDPQTVNGALMLLSLAYVRRVSPTAPKTLNDIVKIMNRALGANTASCYYAQRHRSWMHVQRILVLIRQYRHLLNLDAKECAALQTLERAVPGHLPGHHAGPPLALLPGDGGRVITIKTPRTSAKPKAPDGEFDLAKRVLELEKRIKELESNKKREKLAGLAGRLLDIAKELQG